MDSPIVIDLHIRMIRHGLRLGEVLKRAGVSRASWRRWKNGGDARMSSVLRIEAAIADMITERAAP